MVGTRRVIIDQERSVVCALQERSIENPRTATADLGRQPQQQAERRQAPTPSSFPILTRRWSVCGPCDRKVYNINIVVLVFCSCGAFREGEQAPRQDHNFKIPVIIGYIQCLPIKGVRSTFSFSEKKLLVRVI